MLPQAIFNLIDLNLDGKIVLDEYIMYIIADRPSWEEAQSGFNDFNDTGDDFETPDYQQKDRFANFDNIFDFNLDGFVDSDEQENGEKLL